MGIPNYQYEPLTPPSSWTADEKRLLQRITDIFDDIYMKWGRLDSNHLAQGAVKEKNIAPNAVTDSKILSVDAAKVGRLDAVSFEAVRARIQDLAADLITTNTFEAKFADIENADIDYAKIMDLIAEEAIFSNGTAGQLYINRLAVTQANLLNATINRLIMPGGDGKYYAIVVGSDGVLHTEEVTVTAGEIAAGQLGDGRQIVATTINAGSINGSTINAQSAVINTILTTALTAGKITAGEALISSATIPALYTTAINAIGNSMTLSANESINILVREKSILREASLPSAPVVGQTIAYTGAQPHEALQWTGKGSNPTQRTYEATRTGASVSFEDLSDRHALNLTIKTVASQAGSGTPSPANIRAISGRATVEIEVNDADHALVPAEMLYGVTGAEDEIANSGNETHRTGFFVFDGTEAWGLSVGAQPADTTLARFHVPVTGVKASPKGVSSHFVWAADPSAGIAAETMTGHGGANTLIVYIKKSRMAGWSDAWSDAQKATALKTWLAAQKTAGTPVQAVAELTTATTATVTATTINGADGVNTVTSSGASVTIVYTASGWKRLSNSVIGSNVEITNDHVRIQSDRFSVGNDSAPNNDALVIEDGTVSAPTIESPSVMPAYTGPTTITITPSATEAEIEAGTVFKTLAQFATAINRKWLPGRLTVTVDAATNEYSDIAFNGISGGELIIEGAGTYTGPSDAMPAHTGSLYIWDCQTPVTIRNMRLKDAMSAGKTALVLVRRSTYANLYWCVIEDTGTGGTLVRVDMNSVAFVQSCALVNATGVTATAVAALYGSCITAQDIIGDLSASTVLMNVWGGGTIAWTGTAPVCSNTTLAVNTAIGSALHSISSRVPFRGTQGSGVTQPVSVDIPASIARAHLTNDGWGGALYQGYTPAKGRCTTCYWFDVSALAGRTILSASLKLRRYAGYGRNDGVVVRIHPINNASASGGLSRGDFIAQIGKVSAGATREMELPTSVVEALIAGTYKAIGIYTGETQTMSDRLYSSNYGRWYGDAVLSVTYQ